MTNPNPKPAAESDLPLGENNKLPNSKYQSPPNTEDDFLNGKRPYCGGDDSCESCQ